jgi:hypothetical protein
MLHTPHKIHSGNRIKYEMGSACGTYRRLKRCLQGFGWGDLREGDHFGRSRCSWKVDLKMGIQETRWGRVDWIDVAQDRDK